MENSSDESNGAVDVFTWEFSYWHHSAESCKIPLRPFLSHVDTKTKYPFYIILTEWYVQLNPRYVCGSDGKDAFMSLHLESCKYPSRCVEISGVLYLTSEETEEHVRTNIPGETKDKLLMKKGDSVVLCTDTDRRVFLELLDERNFTKMMVKLVLTISEVREEDLDFSIVGPVPSSLATDLGQLLEDQKFGDVALTSKEKKLVVYKGILAARSPVFAQLFDTHKTDEEVEIEDLEHLTILHLIHYVYTDELPSLTLDLARNLMAAADKYEIWGLKNICEQYLCSNLTIESAIPNLITAILHNGTILKSFTVEFIQCNKEQVGKSNISWLKEIKRHPKIIAEEVLPLLFF